MEQGEGQQYAGLTPGLTPGVGQEVPVVVGGPEPTVAVQFTPPAGVQPGMLGTILDEEVNLVDVTATLVDLAVRGHLQIARDDQGVFRADDWILTRTAPPAGAALVPYEQVLLDSVFAAGNRVALSQLKNTFKPTLDAVERLMYEDVVRRGWFRRSPERQRSGWVGFGTFVAGASVVLLFIAGGTLWSVFGDAGFLVSPAWVLLGGGVATGLIIRSMGKRMAARTATGSAVLAQSRGFQRYIATAEANQIRWEEAQDVFSRFLPFAIVFGLADRWARVFEEVAAAATAAGHAVAGADVVRRRLGLGRLHRRGLEHGLVLDRRGRHLRVHTGLIRVERVQRRRRVLRRWRGRLLGRQLVAGGRRHPRSGPTRTRPGFRAEREATTRRVGRGLSGSPCGQFRKASLAFSPACLTSAWLWSTRPSASRRSSSVALPAASLPLPTMSSFMFSILSPSPMSLSFTRESEHRATS